MEFFKIRKDIPFMRHALIFNVISLVTFIAAVFFLFSRGLHLSVEFTGGTLMEVSYSQAADLGLEMDQQILSVKAPTERWPKELMWLPGFLLFGAVVWQQRRRVARP